MPLTKLASIQHILWAILEDYRIDPGPVFSAANLDPALMFQPGARYPLSGIARIWKEMSLRIDDPCFGLKTAEHWHPSHFGTIGYAMLASPTLRMALERLIRFHRVVSDARFGKLVEDREKKTISIVMNWADESPWSAAREDAALTFILSICRLNFKKPLIPKRVELTHSQPSCLVRYEEFFGCRVRFNRPAPVMTLALSDVDILLRSGDEYLADFHDEIMEHYISKLGKNRLLRKVQKIVATNLPDGNVLIATVAGQLGMSTRKLQRELKEEGTTYHALLNKTRRELAERYVGESYNELIEVAFMLGFADLSTFSRSFKRWTGSPPGRYRKQGRMMAA